MRLFQSLLLSVYPLYLFLLASQALNQSRGFDYVNPLIGTVNGGHVFPGATLPFGRYLFDILWDFTYS